MCLGVAGVEDGADGTFEVEQDLLQHAPPVHGELGDERDVIRPGTGGQTVPYEVNVCASLLGKEKRVIVGVLVFVSVLVAYEVKVCVRLC